MFRLFLGMVTLSGFIHGSCQDKPRQGQDWVHISQAPYVVSRPVSPAPQQNNAPILRVDKVSNLNVLNHKK